MGRAGGEMRGEIAGGRRGCRGIRKRGDEERGEDGRD